MYNLRIARHKNIACDFETLSRGVKISMEHLHRTCSSCFIDLSIFNGDGSELYLNSNLISVESIEFDVKLLTLFTFIASSLKNAERR